MSASASAGRTADRHAAPRAGAAALGCAAAVLLPGLAAGAAAATPAPEATLTVGQLTLHHCETPAPWCGTLERALDPRGETSGTLEIYFEYYPHSGAAAAQGTLVATEGGPGYPATESRDSYLELFEPLRERYDVIIMDNRGSGRSGAIDCELLERAPVLTEAAIGACGRSLGARAPLYSTALAADDLAAILDALGVTQVGLYGNSYGTYFAQVFTLRHPQRVRALVLDGAYPLEGPDYPWWPHYAPAMREKFNRACARSSACAAIPGSSLEHIAPALALLRARARAVQARTAGGTELKFTANATQLATVMFGSAPAVASIRELDAAARAFAAADRAPLLRLMAESLSETDSRDPQHDVRQFSSGLAAAITCGDVPQIYDMTLPPAQRRGARERALAARRSQAPDTYAPFTIDEYRGMPLDYAFLDQCVEWPARTAAWPAATLVPDAPYPDLPVLVVSGDLDSMTPVADGAAAAARFPAAHHVVIANGLHVNALRKRGSECGALLVRRFLAELSTEDDSCASEVPPLTLVPAFARHAAQLPPAQALAGNEVPAAQLSLVTAALLTAEDAITRAAAVEGRGVGLRGGAFGVSAAGRGYQLTLQQLRWCEDLAVSGEIDWPGHSGTVHARLQLRGAQGVQGQLEAEWPEGSAHARAQVHGSLGGRALLAEAAAP